MMAFRVIWSYQSVSVAGAVKFEDILGFYTNSTYGMDISGAPTGERAEKLGNYLINDNYSPCVLNAKRMRAPTETARIQPFRIPLQ